MHRLPAGTAAAITATSAISATVQTAIGGGSLLDNFEHAAVSCAAAAGAFEIGELRSNASENLGFFGKGVSGELAYLVAHAALGCTSAAASGTGCGGGAIGGAASAFVAPYLVAQVGGTGNLTNEQRALIVGTSTLLSGLFSGFAGQKAQTGAMAAENEPPNNATSTNNPRYAAKMLGYDYNV